MLVSIRVAFLLLGLVAVSACGDDPNTQYLPIGERCDSDGKCGTTPFACQTAGYPGGYCTKSCATDGECPKDSLCFSGHCRRTCPSADSSTAPDPTKCRSLEGYSCYSSGATSPYCDVMR